jgi:putative oxidoreductase
MGPIKALISFLGRALLSGIFLAASAHHIQDFHGITAQMVAKNVPQAQYVHYAAVACLILGGVSVLLGFMGRIGAFLLAGFVCGATFYMHNFWALEGEAMKAEMAHFMTNAAILGGLLFILANGAGAGAIDRQKANVVVS